MAGVAHGNLSRCAIWLHCQLVLELTLLSDLVLATSPRQDSRGLYRPGIVLKDGNIRC